MKKCHLFYVVIFMAILLTSCAPRVMINDVTRVTLTASMLSPTTPARTATPTVTQIALPEPTATPLVSDRSTAPLTMPDYPELITNLKSFGLSDRDEFEELPRYAIRLILNRDPLTTGKWLNATATAWLINPSDTFLQRVRLNVPRVCAASSLELGPIQVGEEWYKFDSKEDSPELILTLARALAPDEVAVIRFSWREDWSDEWHFAAAVVYIHGNPVKAGLCREESEWGWSSFNEYCVDG